MKNYLLVSIIFPNFNGGSEPLECLASIAKLNYPKTKIEVIVVDNASTDGSPENIEQRFPHVRLLRNKTNLGFVQAVNLGIKKSTGEYIFIINDDMLFEKNSLVQLVNFINAHSEVGIVGGKIFYKSTPDKIASAGFLFNRWTGHVHSAPHPEVVKQPDWIQGCALFTRRSILRKIGLLDEDFQLIYFEDADLCIRARRAGYKVVYLPYVTIWHGVTTTMNKNKPRKYYEWYKNKLRFVLKHLPFVNIASILFIQIFLVIPFRALILRDGRFMPFVKGLVWNLAHLPETISARYAK